MDNLELSLLPKDIKKRFEYLGDDTNPKNPSSGLNSFYIKDIFNIESIAILLRALKLKAYTSLELEKDVCSNYFNMPGFVELLSKFPNITSIILRFVIKA